MTLKKSIGYYLLMFVLCFIGVTILISIIGSFFSTSMTGMIAIIPFVSAMTAGGRFLKVENRLPTVVERKKLTNGSFFIVIGINLLILALVSLNGLFGVVSGSSNASTVMMIVGGLLLFIFLIIYLMIRWAYGGLLTKQASKMDLNDTTFD